MERFITNKLLLKNSDLYKLSSTISVKWKLWEWGDLFLFTTKFGWRENFNTKITLIKEFCIILVFFNDFSFRRSHFSRPSRHDCQMDSPWRSIFVHLSFHVRIFHWNSHHISDVWSAGRCLRMGVWILCFWLLNNTVVCSLVDSGLWRSRKTSIYFSIRKGSHPGCHWRQLELRTRPKSSLETNFFFAAFHWADDYRLRQHLGTLDPEHQWSNLHEVHARGWHQDQRTYLWIALSLEISGRTFLCFHCWLAVEEKNVINRQRQTDLQLYFTMGSGMCNACELNQFMKGFFKNIFLQKFPA